MIPWLNDQAKNWPDGYRYELGGDDKNTSENMGAVMRYLPLSGFIILILLVIQFNSFRKTGMVLSTIPLGIIGVVTGLIIFRSYYGFMAFLGMISLAGIVINNAIVLLDRIDIEIEEQERTVQDAVIAACLHRFRPILLTTFTTTLGTDSPIPGRRIDVGTHGSGHHVRPSVRHGYHPGVHSGPLQ